MCQFCFPCELHFTLQHDQFIDTRLLANTAIIKIAANIRNAKGEQFITAANRNVAVNYLFTSVFICEYPVASGHFNHFTFSPTGIRRGEQQVGRPLSWTVPF